VLGLCSVLLAWSCVPQAPPHPQRLEVFLSAPVAGANVYLWWVDSDGTAIRKNGTRAPPVFGHDVPDIPLGGPPPTIRMLPATVYDELDDSIVFDQLGDLAISMSARGT
jgi:hypothetical protein